MTDICVPITLERVRARIEIGSNYFVTTGTDAAAAGDIMSFSINASRGQPISTFRCQLVVKLSSNVMEDVDYAENNLGRQIVVYAGVGEQPDQNLPRLFTGYVTNMTTDPHWDDARKFILNVSGEDTFALMKYNKFSRRFKTQDDAFAVITDGKRREGGRMTQLRRIPAGKAGVDWIAAGGGTPGYGEHSPLIRTPDPQGLSPNASRPGSRQTKDTDYQGRYRFEPQHVYANAGDRIFVKIIDEKTGEEVDPTALQYTEGTRCLFCMNPSPSSFETGTTSTSAGMKVGDPSYPITLKQYGSSVDLTAKGVEFIVTGDYPAKITFIHPITAGTCTINFHQIPPHDHRDLPRGGPAVGSYDVYQV